MFVSHRQSPDLNLAFPGVDLLRKIGKVLHFSSHGNIVARIDQAIQLGTLLFTSKATPVGRIVDIFGPTAKPFAAVKPGSQITNTTLSAGSALYQMKGSAGGGGKRRRK